MLCHKCHVRPATVHLSQIIGGASTTLDFCPECAQNLIPSEMALPQPCHYCGGPFACTTPSLRPAEPGARESWPLCQRCAEEMFRYASALYSDAACEIQAYNSSSLAATRQPNQAAELDRHMCAWRSQRQGK